MWKRNLFFVAFCLVGLGSLSGMLLRRDRVASPQDFWPERYGSPEYAPIVTRVDEAFRESWRTQGLEPTPVADSLTVARRLSLALTGTVPSIEELEAWEQLPQGQRLEWWVSHLLADSRCHDYVAERLARAYVGTDQGPFLLFRRRRFVTWLSDQLAQNRAYDEIVREMITAKGLWTDSPAVNFLTATAGGNDDNQPDDIKLAARTARAFLATRIDCLQCHDDKLGTVQLGTAQAPRDGVQSDFHQLAAFYSEATTSLLGINDFHHEYQYKYLHAEKEEVIDPKPPFLDDLVPHALTRREQLARWVTHPENRPFARAIVNRMWGLLFGKPLVEPIDGIPLNGPYPPGLELLAEDFVAHHHDLRRLIRVIAGTAAFQRDSRASFEITPEHESAWAAFPLTRLRPEQVAGGILQSASMVTINSDANVVAQLIKHFQQNDFVSRFGDIGEDEFKAYPSTITQRLLMMNGQLVRERTVDNPVANAATRIAIFAPTNERAIEAAYLAVLTRRPDPQELQHFAAALSPTTSAKGGESEPISRRQLLEDLYWSLINSSEFTWNH